MGHGAFVGRSRWADGGSCFPRSQTLDLETWENMNYEITLVQLQAEYTIRPSLIVHRILPCIVQPSNGVFLDFDRLSAAR